MGGWGGAGARARRKEGGTETTKSETNDETGKRDAAAARGGARARGAVAPTKGGERTAVGAGEEYAAHGRRRRRHRHDGRYLRLRRRRRLPSPATDPEAGGDVRRRAATAVRIAATGGDRRANRAAARTSASATSAETTTAGDAITVVARATEPSSLIVRPCRRWTLPPLRKPAPSWKG